MKPRIAAIYTEWNTNEYRSATNSYGGIGYYRIVKPAEQLRRLGYEVDVLGKEISEWGNMMEAFSRLFISYDIIYIKQVDDPYTASNLLALAEHYGKKVIVDLDDNYLDVRDDNPAFKYYKPGSKERYALGAFISLADGLVTSTAPLKDTYAHLNKSIDVLPNCNDLSDWGENQKKNDGKIRIGYAGSITHNADLELVWEAIKEVLQKYPNVEFELLGAVPKKDWNDIKKRFRSVKGKISFHLGTPSWEGYPELLASMGWDIGIAPLIDDKFNRAKSHIKWMEYSSLKIPTVASKTYPYCEEIQGTKTIEHEKTGYLCETKEDWVKYLSELVESEAKRQEIGDNAHNFIKNNWQYSQHATKWDEVIKKYTDAV